MHDDLKRRLRDEVDAELGLRPPRNLSDALTRGRRKRLALRLVTAMSVVAVGTALVAGGLSIGRELSSDEALPPASPDSDATMVDFPNLTTTLVSPTNGFSVKHPDRAVLTRGKAKDEWGHENDGPMTEVDIVDAGLSAVFSGASAEIPDVPSPDEWVQALTPGRCDLPRSQQAEITIDGRPGRVSECENRIEATVVAGGRLYFFTLEHDRSDARAVFDAFATTIELTPETAVDVPDPTWVEALMNMKKTTFVSPINGYSFKYLDRGGLEPAKELWDPASQRSPVDVLGGGAAESYGFDVVLTGNGAFFVSASTKIPEGVLVDDWGDEAVGKYLPAGCYGPRSQQERITIDGEPGRISQDCADEEVATVVKDGRLYLFMMAHDAPTRDEARQVFEAWVDTIELTPETAAGS